MGLGSEIRKKPIPDPGSRGEKGSGSRIRIRNTVFMSLKAWFSEFFPRSINHCVQYLHSCRNIEFEILLR